MSNLSGTNISSPIVPFTEGDTYPTHYNKYGKGGFFVVSNDQERVLIPNSRLENPTLCYVSDTGSTFKWDGTTWTELSGESSFLTVQQDSDSKYSIDSLSVPRAYIKLTGSSIYHSITILDLNEGKSGEIIIEQTISKDIILENISGVFKMPTRPGDKLYIKYFKKDNIIFASAQEILLKGTYKAPNTIEDLVVEYYDNTTVQLKWTAPHGDLDTDSITGYDIRYSNSLIDVTISSNWISMRSISPPAPLSPNSLQRLTVVNLPSNQEFYLYIKSYQIISGTRYTSNPSNLAYCKTKGLSTSTTASYRIPLTDDNYHVSTSKNDISLENLSDEQSLTTFLESGYPNTTTIPYSTSWQGYVYNRDSSYLRIIIDLFQVYTMDKMFIAAQTKGSVSVYSMQDFGYDLQEIGIIRSTKANSWYSIDFNSTKSRFIVLQYDNQKFCEVSTNPPYSDGAYGIPDPYWNGDQFWIYNILLYGYSSIGKPDNIKPVYRKSTPPKAVDLFACTNGHLYQSGRIHSLISGPNVRLYINPGHFSSVNNNNVPVKPTSIAESRFRINRIPWVFSNGPGMYLQELLEKTYKKYGLKPFICFTATMDFLRYTNPVSGTVYNLGPQIDNYMLQSLPDPLPKNETRGLTEYFQVVANPAYYRYYAKVVRALGARYGKNEDVDNVLKYIWSSPDYPIPEPTTTGLDLISGIEIENEQDAAGNNFIHYHHPHSCSALMSAVFDGHHQTLVDENNDNSVYGIHQLDQDFGIMMGGLASSVSGYYMSMLLTARSIRKDYIFPSKCLNLHLYITAGGVNGDTLTPSETVAKPFEVLLDKKNFISRRIAKTMKIRNWYMPDTEMWMTEFGYGEGGHRGLQGTLQCFSQPGKYIDDWVLPDLHRSDIKGAWTVRAFIVMMYLGYDSANNYITFAESSWWDSGSGAGEEMFKWDELTNTTPGYKYLEIEQYEGVGSRGGFATLGMFGDPITNAGYPISRAFWYVSLFRNLLKGYTLVGKLNYSEDPKVLIFAFKKENEDKGAYVIYYNSDKNDGITNVTVPIPENNGSVKKVTTYIPKLPNPTKVPYDLGNDQLRTGIPTTRKEKYIGGQWVIQNRKPDTTKDLFESMAQSPANYPLNPVEGDEVVVFPTQSENPYFPIVGPVGARKTKNTQENLGANKYEYSTIKDDGTVIWSSAYNSVALPWRQVDAICDYIELHPEGIKGSKEGISEILNTIANSVKINVSVIPQYLFFDGIPETSFESEIDSLSSLPVNSSTIQLWWNNNNTEDTGYQVFISNLPDSNFSMIMTVDFGNNTAIVSGLLPNTTYYFKVRPICNNKLGTLSDSISAKPYSFLPDITNIRVGARSTSSIEILWDYQSDIVADFYAYGIYKSNSGIWDLIHYETDQSIHSFTDLSLSTGTFYTYKIKVIGLNGKSNFSPELNVRTLLETESSPIIKNICTDKLGTKIIIEYNLPIQISNINIKTVFTLTESGNNRLITNGYVDEINPALLILALPNSELSEYSKNKTLLLTYLPNDYTYISSSYGNKADSFINKIVINNIGNFINLLATYKINFTIDNYLSDPSLYWNDLVGNPASKVISLTNLIDTYGLSHSIGIYNNYTSRNVWGTARNWGSFDTSIDPTIPTNVWSTNWLTYSPKSQGYPCLFLTGLNTSNKYDIILYSGYSTTSTNVVTVWFTINGKNSNAIVQNKNSNQFMEIDDLVPNNSGELSIYLPLSFSDSTATYANGAINFMYIKEYLNETTPPNTYVYLQKISIDEDIYNEGKVTTNTVNVRIVSLGNITNIMISEDESFNLSQWQSFENPKEYLFTPGDYGNKTLFVKLKNDSGESNVKSISFIYQDPYIPLVLNSVIINEGNSLTYNNTISIFLNITGNPTFFKIGESSEDLDSLPWIPYSTSSIEFTLSNTSGLHYIYVKLKDSISESEVHSDSITYNIIEYDYVDLDITIPSTLDKNQIELKFPTLKFNKKLILTYNLDDTANLYQYLFAGVNKRPIVTGWSDGVNGYKHLYDTNPVGVTETSFVPEKFLQISDGAGVLHRFTFSTAGWPLFLIKKGVGGIYGRSDPWTSEKEMKFFQKFGWTMQFHDTDGYVKGTTTTQSSFDDTVSTTINNFLSTGVRVPKILVEPNGDHIYIPLSQGNANIQMIVAQSGVNIIRKAYPYKDGFTLSKDNIVVSRDFWYTVGVDNQYWDEMLNKISTLNQTSDKSTIYWVCMASHGFHGSIRLEYDFFSTINDLYGSIGQDNIWVTTYDEFFEYWFMSENTTVTKSVLSDGNTIRFSLKIPKPNNFWFRDLSVLISGISSTEGVSVSSDACYGLSYAINDGKLLVNFNFDPTSVSLAEEFVSYYESNPTVTTAKDDAIYFAQKLKTSIKNPFISRIDAITSPPNLLGIIINNNDSITRNNQVEVVLNTSGTQPTHYMISEDPDFNGEVWITWVNSFSYLLSLGYGLKTVYCKIKNTFGESLTKIGTIEYRQPLLDLNSIVIDNGNSITTDIDLAISFIFSGTPTHYMISENSNFNGASWQSYQTPVIFSISDSYGTKQLFAKLKNDELETNIVSGQIVYQDNNTAVLNSISINNDSQYSSSTTLSISLNSLGLITKYRIGTVSDLSNSNWIPISGNINYESQSIGDITIYVQVANETSISLIKSDSITIVLPVIINNIVLNSGQSAIIGYNCPVTINVTSGTPTHYMISENSNFNGSSWEIWGGNNYSYLFSSFGIKTLYAKVKNEVSESLIVNSSITTMSPPTKIILANISTILKQTITDVGVINSNNMVYNLSASGGANLDALNLYSTVGDLFCKRVDWFDTSNTSTQFDTKFGETFVSTTRGNTAYFTNTGIVLTGAEGYPSSMLSSAKNVLTWGVTVAPTLPETRWIIQKLYQVPIGTYKIRLLHDTYVQSKITNYSYRVNNSVQTLTNTLSSRHLEWVTFDSISVDSSGLMIIGYRPNFNTSYNEAASQPIILIEITKLS